MATVVAPRKSLTDPVKRAEAQAAVRVETGRLRARALAIQVRLRGSVEPLERDVAELAESVVHLCRLLEG